MTVIKTLALTALTAAITLLPAQTKRIPNAGALSVIDKDGNEKAPCPLKRTDVKAEISGFVSRVNVRQNYENPLNETVEAVYTFPLPRLAAVDRMTMKIGDRHIEGKIKPREEARAIYEHARTQGRTASLLEQERPNIFTQSIANIPPGAKVEIEISYVETLKYEAGTYEFSFPMVVGPRYIPGKAIGKQAGGWAPDTNRVPDASRITPPVAPPDTRAGHDLTLEVALDAGVPLQKLESTSHQVITDRPDNHRAIVKLKNEAVIPNKDFILRYDVAGAKIADAILTHKDERGGFFSLVLQPPARVTQAEVTPRELVFVIDTSGSQMGFPMEKSKEVMRMALQNLHPRDTFNLITFAGDTHLLFPAPVPATPENLAKAREFMESRRGGGGTEMMKAIRAALQPTTSQEHLRVVAFLTDGYVGNDFEIISEIQKYSNARIFSFGIGNAANRFLLDKMAEAGRGEVEYVTLESDGSVAAKRFYERMRDPVLTDIKVEFAGVQVSEVYPARILDLFAAKPVVVHGRYNAPANGVVKISGKAAGKPYYREVKVNFPAVQPQNDSLASLWAREKIEDLMARDYKGLQSGIVSPELKNDITKVGIDYRLMTQFTAFVAVEEKVVNEGGKQRRIEVPVEMPEGVSHKGVFGEQPQQAQVASAPIMMGRATGFAGGARYKTAEPSTAPHPIRADVPRETEARQERDQKLTDSRSKLHPTLFAALEAFKAGKKQGTEKVNVVVYLLSDATLQDLKAAGLETQDTKLGALVKGSIRLDKLEAFLKLAKVRYVSPLT